MRLLLLLIGVPAWACSPAEYQPCSADEAHYTIIVDSVQATLSRDSVKLDVKQRFNHQVASIHNESDLPLYKITEKPDDSLPFIVKEKKKWYVEARYTQRLKNACLPVIEGKAKSPTTNLANIKWNCDENNDSCGEPMYPSELILPSGMYPLGWSANGLTKEKIALPKVTEQKYTQYFFYDNKIEKVTLVSSLVLNDDYLKVSCDKNAKLVTCGTDCIAFVNLDTPLKKTVSASFKFKTEEHDFSDKLEIEIFVDSDFKAQATEVGALIVKNGVEALSQIFQDGDFDQVPLDYLAQKIAGSAYPDIIRQIGPAWKFQLTRVASPQKSTRSKSRTHRGVAAEPAS